MFSVHPPMHGTEMPSVTQHYAEYVDEVEGGADADVDFAQKKAKTFLGKDWDQIFSYRTFKVVRIRDAHLGMLFWFMVSCIILYITIFVFGFEGKHQDQEWGVGTVITRFKGKAFCDGVAYDEADLRHPQVEASGAFIMTKSLTVKGQTLGACVDYDAPCPCPGKGICKDDEDDTSKGWCRGRAWCPSIGIGNEASPPNSTIVRVMEGLESTRLELMAGIAFPGIGNYFFVAGKSEGASNPYHNITLGELLSHAQPPLKMRDVLHSGALISVSFLWSCDVAIACEPQVLVRRMDRGKGFVQRHARMRTLAGDTSRDAIYMKGLRILVDSSGIGRRTSFVLIVMQIASGIALLRTASMSADFIMLKLYPAKRATAYRKFKIIPTSDYSDLQDRINLIQEEKERLESEAEKPTPLKVLTENVPGRIHVLQGPGGAHKQAGAHLSAL